MTAVPKDLMPDNPTRRDLYVIDIGAIIIIDITLVLLNLLLYYFLKHMKIKKNDKLNSEELDNNIKHLTKIIILFLIFSLFLLIRFSNSSYAIMAVSEEYYGYKFAILNFLFILFVNIILEVIANRTYKINITQVIFNAIIESNIVILTIIQRIIFGYNFLFVIIGLIGFALLKFRVLSYKKKKYNLPIKLVLTSISCIIIFISTYTCSLISTDKSGEEKMFRRWPMRPSG